MKLVLTQPRLSVDPAQDNFQTMRRLLDAAKLALGPEDIVVLPERCDERPGDAYRGAATALARDLGCNVIAGSRHVDAGELPVNAGLALGPRGEVLGEYEKLRPYSAELGAVRPGRQLGELRIVGCRVLVLICADFWFSDVFERCQHPPDLVLVPALSVTRHDSPYARSLWQHLAIARAYEFGSYVGVADWAEGSDTRGIAVGGAAGFANPTQVAPERFFTPAPQGGLLVVDIDLGALAAFRRDRAARGFFWRPIDPVPDQVGLCASCRHSRKVESSKGSVFYLCQRSQHDGRLSKYPRLPKLACFGYE
jgi:predicted amidohydrolase